MELDAARDEVEVEVIAQGKSGFLGFGSSHARVRLTRLGESGQLVRTAKSTVDRLLKLMSISATSTIARPADNSPNTYTIQISGDDSGLLIGTRGSTLRALQFVTNIMLAHQGDTSQGRVVVDVENYKERRAGVLKGLALRIADRVGRDGRSVTLDPMPANERRVIHMTLAEHQRVTTESHGEGQTRQVTITPRNSGLTRRPGRGMGSRNRRRSSD